MKSIYATLTIESSDGGWIVRERGMNLEEIEYWTNFVVTTDADKMPERIEAAEVILREDVPALIAEVKRLRKQLELEHDQGESFLTQIKELRAENERLQAELDGFIHGGL